MSRLLLCAGGVALLLAAVGTSAPVNAHGGEAGIDVFPNRAPAGGAVTVIGEDLEPSTLMALHLLTPDGDALVGEPMTDAVGHFSFPLSLSDDLRERVYELRLTAPSGESSSTFVTIVNSEAVEGTSSAPPDIRIGLMAAGLLTVASIVLLVRGLRPRRT